MPIGDLKLGLQEVEGVESVGLFGASGTGRQHIISCWFCWLRAKRIPDRDGHIVNILKDSQEDDENAFDTWTLMTM